MKRTSSLTLRLNSDLLRALKIRAIMNDRSANGEISAILKEALTTKKTEEAMLAGQTSSVSQQ